MKAARRPITVRQAARGCAASIARLAMFVPPEMIAIAVVAAVLLLGGAV